MRKWFVVAAVASVAAIAGALSWWLMLPRDAAYLEGSAEGTGRILYYQDPSGAPFFSMTAKKNAQGRDYIAIRAIEPRATTAPIERKVLYYRNPMGLPDTSPVPKKDNMGMDYIPVYADEPGTAAAPGAVRISLDRVQKLGVRTSAVTRKPLVQSLRLTGTVMADESKQSVVSLKFAGSISKLHVAVTGARVRRGDALFDLNSPFLLKQEAELAIALRSADTMRELGGVYARTNRNSVANARERLRLYEIPEQEIERLVRTRVARGRVTWYALQDGTILEKPAVAGMQVEEGAILYRLADLSTVWVIADVPEALLGSVANGLTAEITLNAYPGRIFRGAVTFIYPEVAMTTRTVKIRIELANPGGSLKPGMYAAVNLDTGAREPVLVAPESALIDAGSRQVVLIARDGGTFEPRPVVVGRRGGGEVELVDGIKEGEQVVTSATFLIDAESNLRAALQGFTANTETPK
jgi:Cu(I)/Ag(I) efflux system membrane fusion protein